MNISLKSQANKVNTPLEFSPKTEKVDSTIQIALDK